MQTFPKRFFLASTIVALSATPAFAQAALAPTLKVITPQEGQTLYGTKVPILIGTENLTLTDYQTNTTAVPGQGHVHLWLDDPNPTKESAVKIITDNFTFSDVQPGDHILKTEVVGNNHISLSPPLVQTIQFKTDQLSSPTPAATSGFDKNTALVILFVVALVIISAWWYTREDDDEMEVSEDKPKKQTAKKTTRKKPAKRSTRSKSK